MLFNSIHFLLFFPAVLILYFSLSRQYRWMLLLAGSYYFYMCWKPEYAILILLSTLVDYYAAIRMEAQPGEGQQGYSPWGKRKFLVLSLVINLGMLFTFKYFNFFNESLRFAFDQLNIFYEVPEFDLLLPVGISFYTFQTLSYSIDVYKGRVKAERHLGIFALYVSFFPQLVAGPIERPSHLLPQLRQPKSFNYEMMVSGLRLMLFGFFKKVVIADRMAAFVKPVYANPDEYTGLPILLATICFAFQIYCDFSGYSDIAIGTARVMGFDLMENFRRPYFSRSIREFWRRWHISLSSWFRDYVYIPLGGNRTLKWRWYYNLLITFLVSGLWHGANWTFVIWGWIHGQVIIFEYMLKGLGDRYQIKFSSTWKKALLPLQVLFTFSIVCLAWIFFRAENVGEAFTLIGNLFQGSSQSMLQFFGGEFHLLLSLISLGILLGIDGLQDHFRISQFPSPVRWAFYLILLFSILFFGVFDKQEFIYFQF